MSKSLSAFVLAVLLLGSPGSARADELVSLSPDGLSFYFVGAGEAGDYVPSSAISMTVDELAQGHWSIVIPAASFLVSGVVAPDGSLYDWSLREDATGAITFSGSAPGDVFLVGAFQATNAETGEVTAFDLRFSTGEAASSTRSGSVVREGARLDRSAGYLQLVAASTMPPGSENGVPFAVVISGTIAPLPAGLTGGS